MSMKEMLNKKLGVDRLLKQDSDSVWEEEARKGGTNSPTAYGTGSTTERILLGHEISLSIIKNTYIYNTPTRSFNKTSSLVTCCYGIVAIPKTITTRILLLYPRAFSYIIIFTSKHVVCCVNGTWVIVYMVSLCCCKSLIRVTCIHCC